MLVFNEGTVKFNFGSFQFAFLSLQHDSIMTWTQLEREMVSYRLVKSKQDRTERQLFRSIYFKILYSFYLFNSTSNVSYVLHKA